MAKCSANYIWIALQICKTFFVLKPIYWTYIRLILNVPNWICFEKRYVCVYVAAACLWIPEHLLKIFKMLCLFFCSVINLTLQQQHLLKMVNSICQITQLKPKSNYYSGSLKAIWRPRGLSRNYFMDKRTKINLYSCILSKGLLAQQYSSLIAFCVNTFNLTLFF